jgi:hypothetical protein
VISRLTIENSYLHDVSVGMEVQSRANFNTIANNRIFDNGSTASYDISLPNGGGDIVSANVIEKGLHSETHKIISFMQAPASTSQPHLGTDAGHWANSSLTVDGDTFVLRPG